MPAEVCLLLMQSLTGDCELSVPRPATDVPLVTDTQADWAEPAVTVAAETIAPTESRATPRFADLCRDAEAQQLAICAFSSATRQSEPATRPMATTGASASEAPSRSPQTATAAASRSLPVTLPAPVDLPATQRPVSAPTMPMPQFTSPATTIAANPAVSSRPSPAILRPSSGSELYRQRQIALQSGQSYTRLSPSAYANQWRTVSRQPTYEDWQRLLWQEARAMSYGQGRNRLEVVVGDSFGLWLPPEMLPRDRLWLNQSISGDTTAGILRRVNTFANTRATTIHLMAGANDLKTGVPEAQIISNLHRTVRILQQQHPQAQIVVYSVLPTRRAEIGNDRVRSLNAQIARMTERNGVVYRDIHPQFQDEWGHLHPELTTDGLHLNPQGYALWQRAILASAG